MTVQRDALERIPPQESDTGRSPDAGVRPSRIYDGDIHALGRSVVDEIQPTLDLLAAHDRGEQIDVAAQD